MIKLGGTRERFQNRGEKEEEEETSLESSKLSMLGIQLKRLGLEFLYLIIFGR